MYNAIQKAKLLRFHDLVLTRKVIPGFDDFVAPDYVEHYHDEDVEGLDAAKNKLAELFLAFPDGQWHSRVVLTEDDYASTYYLFSGTHQGPYREVEPTWAKVKVAGFDLVRFTDDDLFAERWVFLDLYSLIQQLVPGDEPVAQEWKIPDNPDDFLRSLDEGFDGT